MNRNPTVIAALLEALSLVGGVAYLVKIARTDPAVFCALLRKCIPQEV